MTAPVPGAATAAMVALGHRHFGAALLIVALVVVAGLVYFGIRAGNRHRGKAPADHHWRPTQPPPAPPATSGEPAWPSSPPTACDGSAGPGVPPAPAAGPAGATAPVAVAEARPSDVVPAATGAATVPTSAPGAVGVPPPGAVPVRRAVAAGNSHGWAVETHGLTKRFGANVAVDGVELLVPRGCAFGYLGPNGAGKTTLIRTLLGLTRADGGTMSLLGIPVPSERTRALARVGAIVDEPRFYGHLTGRENLLMLAAARGEAAEARIAPSLERVGLTERAGHRVSSYSMGMRQRLGVASCLLGDPELLILDEPMNGLDPAGMHEMREMIQSLVGEGRTVMLSSHLLDEVERTCDAVAIVDHGRVVRQGTIDELVRGSGVVMRVACSDPVGAARLIGEAGLGMVAPTPEGDLSVTLAAGADREVVAEINRRLVEARISVYAIVELRTSLEDWFLSVTTRLGDRP